MNICILARKRLFRNTRIIRQAKVLAEAGHNVSVAALELPSEKLRALTPAVSYIQITLNPLPIRIIKNIRLIKPGFKRFRHRNKAYWHFMSAPFISVKNLTKKISNSSTQNNNKKPSNQTKKPNYLFLKLNNRKSIGEYLISFISPYINSANTIDFAKQCVSYFDGQQFDYCQSHDSFSLYATYKVAEKTGAKIVYDAVEIPYDRSGIALKNTPRLIKYYQLWRDSRIIKKADKVLTIGPALSEITAKTYKINPPAVIRNCCLFKKYLPNNDIKKDLNLLGSEKLGLVIGAIYNNQGLEQLIESIPYLNEDIHIAALGPESETGYNQKLIDLAIKAGVDNRFHIIAPKPPQLLHEYASGADLGVIARQRSCLNNTFSLPNKVFEMIMSRLPIVCGQLPNIIAIVKEYGIGRHFDETDPHDIAFVINNLITDSKIFSNLAKSVEKAALELNWECEGKKYVAFIES